MIWQITRKNHFIPARTKDHCMQVGEPYLSCSNIDPTLILSIENAVTLIDTQNKHTTTGKRYLIPAAEKVMPDTNNSYIALCDLYPFSADVCKFFATRTLRSGSHLYTGKHRYFLGVNCPAA